MSLSETEGRYRPRGTPAASGPIRRTRQSRSAPGPLEQSTLDDASSSEHWPAAPAGPGLAEHPRARGIAVRRGGGNVAREFRRAADAAHLAGRGAGRFALAGVVLFAVGLVMYFRTRNGMIVFENLPERSIVAVDGDTLDVEWPDGKGKGHAQITIAPGKHQVKVTVNGVQVTGAEVSVAKGQVTPFVVRIAPPPELTDQPRPPPALTDRAPRRVTNSIGMTLLLIAPGEFQMGSDYGPPGEDDRPPHLVRISHPYYLGAFEVTQEQYENVMGKNPSHFSGQPQNPVDDVTWFDAVTFCNKLSEREKLALLSHRERSKCRSAGRKWLPSSDRG